MSEKQKNKSKKPSKFGAVFVIIASFFICIGIFAVVAAILLPMLESLLTTTNEFMEVMQDEDYDRAITFLTNDLQARVDAQEIETLISEFDAVPTSWSFNSQNFENNVGRAIGRVTLSNGETVSLTLGLLNENNEWKISYFEWGYVNSEKL